MNVEIIPKMDNIDPKIAFRSRLRVAAYCRVSTDDADQLKSYKSMVEYYTDYINNNPEWSFAGVYADEAVTGTRADKREGFLSLIEDCKEGKIDHIVTKSISRFARNTLDTLKYVRLLRDIGIGITFEVEHINTLKDGEFLLTILGSVAQQEVANTSVYVKKGLRYKMSRGDLVGSPRCIGYDYDESTKSLIINKDEAEVVRKIFTWYNAGLGCDVIARELNKTGSKTIRGNDWCGSTVLGIIKNEKYCGDLIQGKTITVDPIAKRRISNLGEEEKFLIRDHHEAIISRETFEAAQDILSKRTYQRKEDGSKPGVRMKYSRQYAFSSMLECGFCGSHLTRKSWHSKSIYAKPVWMCTVSSKKGKTYCPESKGIDESIIEDAFVEVYQLITNDNSEIIDKFLKRVESTMGADLVMKRLNKARKNQQEIERKRQNLVEKFIDNAIDEAVYKPMDEKLADELEKAKEEVETLSSQQAEAFQREKRIQEFKRMLQARKKADSFDRMLFESVIEKVIVGGYDDEGRIDPYKLTFVFKSGFAQDIEDAKMRYTLAEKPEDSICSGTTVDVCSNESDSACGDSMSLVQTFRSEEYHRCEGGYG